MRGGGWVGGEGEGSGGREGGCQEGCLPAALLCSAVRHIMPAMMVSIESERRKTN